MLWQQMRRWSERNFKNPQLHQEKKTFVRRVIITYLWVIIQLWSRLDEVNMRVDIILYMKAKGSRVSWDLWCFFWHTKSFFVCKNGSYEQMFTQPNSAPLALSRTYWLLSQWVGFKIWKQCPSLVLPPSLPHVFGTIMPLFNSVFWSGFTAAFSLSLPFSSSLMRLCVIDKSGD